MFSLVSVQCAHPTPHSRLSSCLFQYDREFNVGDEELDLWEAVRREWSIEQAWECECNQYFSGLQCETPGIDLTPWRRVTSDTSTQYTKWRNGHFYTFV